MPFEIAPKFLPSTNPWVKRNPKKAEALAALARYVRGVPADDWDFGTPFYCGSACCALGHAVMVPECKPYMSKTAIHPTLDAHRIGLDFELKDAFFFGAGWEYTVTPQMVADRIEHWLATGEIN